MTFSTCSRQVRRREQRQRQRRQTVRQRATAHQRATVRRRATARQRPAAMTTRLPPLSPPHPPPTVKPPLVSCCDCGCCDAEKIDDYYFDLYRKRGAKLSILFVDNYYDFCRLNDDNDVLNAQYSHTHSLSFNRHTRSTIEQPQPRSIN
jgi:hypothetical protein